MIRVGIGQLLAALLFLINAFTLDGHPVLMFFNLVAMGALIWAAFDKIDPPTHESPWPPRTSFPS